MFDFQQVGFLLLPSFTHIGLAAAIEPLRIANVVAGKTLFEFHTLSQDGAAVIASNGIQVLPDTSLCDPLKLDALFVVGSNPVVHRIDHESQEALRRRACQGVALGGICTGSYPLARAGLLDGYRCTIHWEDLSQFTLRFPQILVSPRLFEVDRDRYTCAGGTASMDMMLELIAQGVGGRELAAKIAELMNCDRIRSAVERQRIPLKLRLGAEHPRLSTAAALMEANLEEPLDMDELGQLVGISRRQLERLFHDHLDTTPTRYYLRVRLEHARRGLRQGNQPITEIALACGFVSVSHFSTRYRDLFGHSPRAERRSQSNGLMSQFERNFAKQQPTL